MILKYLIQKEFRQFFRNSFMPKLAVVFPTVIILVFPWAATMEVNNVNVSIVDQDHSITSQRLANKIDGSTYFILQHTTALYADALNDVERGKADIIVEIPRHFERDLINTHKGSIQLSANGVNPQKSGVAGGYLQNIIGEFAAEWTSDRGISIQQPLSINVKDFYNPTLNYQQFMIPALMTMVLIMLCGLLPALNIVSEKEVGTIEQINVTPVPKAAFILSKLIPYWAMGYAILSICFVLSWLVYGYAPAGSFSTIYTAATLFILVMSGIGLIISNYAVSMQQALFIMFFFIMIFMLMSGLFTDVRSMPDWAQDIAYFNPPRYFINIMRSVFQRGGDMVDNGHSFVLLAIFAFVVNIWAVLSYKKQA
jgi:ABC-2 type transport system permease protein